MLGTRKADASSPLNGGSTYEKPSTSPFQISVGNDPSKDSVHSIVDKHLTMKGDLESDGDIMVKGKVIGNIKCKLLIVDTDALVEGGIDAEEVVIRGRAKGKVHAEKVRLERTASIDCEISHRSFSAEEGAKIRGSLKFIEEAVPANDGVALVN